MSESCSGNCSNCGSDCASRQPESLLAPANAHSNVKKVIAVVSGKGGVGKSTVTSLLAVAMHKLGYKTAILDADITGPSIPQAFGLHSSAAGSDEGIFPVETEEGIKVMSINLLLDHETDPVVWRGPVVAGAVKQFWSDVQWGDVDYMFVDLPPGTGDVPLTVFQSLPVDGVVIVTSVQGSQYGADDECAGVRLCGELQLFPVSGLRKAGRDLRQEQSCGDRAGIQPAGAGTAADRPECRGALRRGEDGGGRRVRRDAGCGADGEGVNIQPAASKEGAGLGRAEARPFTFSAPILFFLFSGKGETDGIFFCFSKKKPPGKRKKRPGKPFKWFPRTPSIDQSLALDLRRMEVGNV